MEHIKFGHLNGQKCPNLPGFTLIFNAIRSPLLNQDHRDQYN